MVLMWKLPLRQAVANAFHATNARNGRPIKSVIAIVRKAEGDPFIHHSITNETMLIATATLAKRRLPGSNAAQTQITKTARNSAARCWNSRKSGDSALIRYSFVINAGWNKASAGMA